MISISFQSIECFIKIAFGLCKKRHWSAMVLCLILRCSLVQESQLFVELTEQKLH